MCGEERSVGKGGVWGGEEGEVRGGLGGEGRVCGKERKCG